ncbi:hypothetical protein ABZP36_009147 [Zizania latifolia]
MSTRRSGRLLSAPAAAAAPTDEQIADLISKLQAVLRPSGHANGKQASRAEVLQEACRYIRRLHRESDALSQRLAELLLQPSDRTIDGADTAELIRSLLM